ncbi:MAG: c-type cytochrome [Anaerolineales bacterium]|nr:c-type cytochrome [Anaerolineales bacterium]MCX7607990.1 c-type cytochrome [Anaerolineales bacterium]MDW8226669.1 c-type cytochrome [Anaerolineales bacterium]
MNEEQKKAVLAKYQRALQKGERFWPDSLYKDLIVSMGLFLLLILLATFVGIPNEPKADPSDSSYIPKPEWYFLFLFKFLALYGQIPLLGKIEWIATVLIPSAVILGMILLPFLDQNPYRHYTRRVLALTIMAVFVVSMITLTMMADYPTAVDEQGHLTLPTWLQMIGGLLIPGATYLTLLVLAALAKKLGAAARRAQIGVAAISSVLMFGLAIAVMLVSPRPVVAESEVADTLAEKFALGADLYSIYCTECHGADGEVTVITGVEGLEGREIVAINNPDLMYTNSDETLANIIAYGLPSLGMPPFGKAYGGELGPSEIEYIVTFMRYSWDDRAELPADAAISSIPELAPGEIPSYEVHIAALTKRYCLSCHRPGKENNNYLMTSYEEIIGMSDNGPAIVAGDPNSLLLLLIQGQEQTDKNGDPIRAMPPNKLMDPKYIEMWKLWVLNGMPKTAEDARTLSPTPSP